MRVLIIGGTGLSLWTSCYRDDVARAFVNAVGNAATYGQAYHLAGEEWLTWNRYHQGVAQALGVPPPPLVHIPTDLLVKIAPERAYLASVNFQFNNIFDTSAARRDLAFRYTVPWVEGVQRMAAWLDTHGRIENSDDEPFEDRLIAAWRGVERQLEGLEAR